MMHGADWTLYVLERDEHIVYCSSLAVVSALPATGWTLRDSGHWSTLVEGLATDPLPSTQGDPV